MKRKLILILLICSLVLAGCIKTRRIIESPTPRTGSLQGQFLLDGWDDHQGILIQISTDALGEVAPLTTETDAEGYFSFTEIPLVDDLEDSVYQLQALYQPNPTAYTYQQDILVSSEMETELEQVILDYHGRELMVFGLKEPWDDDSKKPGDLIQEILSEMKIPYQLYSSDELAEISFSQEKALWLLNDQTYDHYAAYVNNAQAIEQFVGTGGRIIFGAGEKLFLISLTAAGGTLPGGITNPHVNSNINYSRLPEHPIMQGLGEEFTGGLISTNYFDNLPDECNILMVNEMEVPTLIEYPYQQGKVIATGQILEYSWENEGSLKDLLARILLYTCGDAI